MYYTDFERRDDHELAEIFPGEGGDGAVPAALNFQDLDENDYIPDFTPIVFQEWLSEGRHNCDIAQAVLHVWTHDLLGAACDSLHDFFTLLFDEYVAETCADAPTDNKCRFFSWPAGFESIVLSA